jgi:uncharacterized RDD family membrane protein YckC
MRCPKCHYISFGSVERCRNCGYEFALVPEPQPIDLPIQNADEPVGPYDDFILSDRSATPPSSVGETTESRSASRRQAGSRFDLPLFSDRDPGDDAPLVSPSSVPRAPLSVRRRQPAVARARPERLPAEDTDQSVERSEIEADEDLGRLRDAITTRPETRESRRDEPLPKASIVARLFAGLIDVLLLSGIDVAVVYSTLRVLELSFEDYRLLPPVPMSLFLLLLNGGYLAVFTAAGGQTIGKMIGGIKVVAQPDFDRGPDAELEQSDLPVTLGASVLRAAAYLVSLLPAGLGFLPILLARDGRALHDRLANTRVVKA